MFGSAPARCNAAEIQARGGDATLEWVSRSNLTQIKAIAVVVAAIRRQSRTRISPECPYFNRMGLAESLAGVPIFSPIG